MRIDADQQARMKRAHAASTLRTVIAHCHREEGDPIDQETAEALVDVGARLAHEYGMRGDYACGILAYLTWQFGENFERVIPPIRAILLDGSIEDKPNALLDAAARFWDIWSAGAGDVGAADGSHGGARR
ncbi:MAG: hypothetical protein ACTHL8_13195 [Burkholderiaceae bacterium]